MYKLLLILLTLLVTSTSYARLGESKIELKARLGEPSEQQELPQFNGVLQMRWNQKNRVVYEVWFFDGKSIFESVTSPFGLSVEQTSRFLKAQTSEWEAIQKTPKGVAYSHDKGKWLAFASINASQQVVQVVAVNREGINGLRTN